MSAYVKFPAHLPPFWAGLLLGAASRARQHGDPSTAQLMEDAAVQLWPDAEHHLPKRVDIDHVRATSPDTDGGSDG